MKPASLLPLVLLALAFYWLVIRPGQKARVARAELISSLQPGSQVLTTGGIRGTIVEMGDDDVLLEIAPGVRVHFVSSAIAAVKGTSDESDAEGDDEGDDRDQHDEHDAEPHDLTESSDPSEPTT